MLVSPCPEFPQDRVTSLSGLIRHHRAFSSKILGNTRNLIVYLPPDYEQDRRRRYPVFYMHDGQNLMDGMTSFIPNKEWRVDETAEALIRAKAIPPLIIVGIDNAGMARGDEYLPTRATMKSGPTFGGKGDLYGRMIIEEVMPLIKSTYRTAKGSKNTWLGGSSLGGIISLYLGLTHADVFGKLAVVSPSVWWDDRDIVKRVASLPKKLPLKIWLDIGTSESDGAVGDTRILRDALVKKGWAEGKDLLLFEDKDAQHNEEAWAKRFGMMLLWLSQ